MRDPPLILVVDDTPENLDIVSMRLESRGYQLATAVDGEDALEKTYALKPDLVLLDIMMPKLDGLAVLQRLKADRDLPFIPIILLTAKADARDVVAGLEAGGDDYLTKPVDHAALLARVRSMLRIKSLHDQVEAQRAELALWNKTLEERVQTQLAEIERVGRLKRFLAPQLAQMLAAGEERILDSHRRDIAVLFCDLRGFTAFAETGEPEEVMALLQGYATLGRIGFEGRIDYGAIGTVTNLAARLCAEAKDGEILVTSRVALAVEPFAELRDIGEVAFKGLSRPTVVSHVIGLKTG